MSTDEPRALPLFSQEYKKLAYASKALSGKIDKKKYSIRIENVFYDFGENRMWTTLVIYRKGDKSVTGSYQLLNPVDWNNIVNADSEQNIDKTVDKIAAGIKEREK